MIEFTDRYKALGIPYPDPQTMCRGQCEGTGLYPFYADENDNGIAYEPGELTAWLKCHEKCNFINRFISRWKYMEWGYWKSLFEKCDGYHFIKCKDCNGTGKSPEGK